MSPLNIEIKARYNRTEKTHLILDSLAAEFQGVKEQVDTYFDVTNGRLKLREQDPGSDYLIYYDRENTTAPKRSDCIIAVVQDTAEVGRALSAAVGVRTEVRKMREFWLWENVRVLLDQVDKLGTYLELEVVCSDEAETDEAYDKIEYLMDLFGVRDEDLVPVSYSDLLSSE